MQVQQVARKAQLLGVSLFSLGLVHLVEPAPSVAQVCNAFGCSQPGAAACNPFGCPQPGARACNPFGCPNPGAGDCTPFGCPASPNNNPSNNPPANSPSNSSGPANRPSNGPRASRSFQITNNTGQEFYYFYASPANQDAWSDDLLGNSTLPHGQAWNITTTRGCLYDFWAELRNGQTLTWDNIDVCSRDRITLNP